jgi:hypothetical protein
MVLYTNMSKPTSKSHSRMKLLCRAIWHRDNHISHCRYQRENSLNFSFFKIITIHQNLLLHITSPRQKWVSCVKEFRQSSRRGLQLYNYIGALRWRRRAVACTAERVWRWCCKRGEHGDDKGWLGYSGRLQGCFRVCIGAGMWGWKRSENYRVLSVTLSIILLNGTF